MNEIRTGRGSDQFPLRLPDGMRDKISKEAKSNGRSMNSEIVARIEQSFSDIPRADERVQMLEKSVSMLMEQSSKTAEKHGDPLSPFLSFFEITDDDLSRLRSSVQRLRDFQPKEVTSLNSVKIDIANRLIEMANMLKDD